MRHSSLAGDEPAIPVIVLGTGITALGVQRIFAGMGVPAYLAERPDALLRRSRRYRALPRDPGVEVTSDLESWLPHARVERAVLLPCADSWASAVANLDPALRARFPSSAPPAEAIGCLVDKGRFAEALVRLRIPHPRSFELTSVEDLDRIPPDAARELFLKPRDSQSFFRAFGVKAFKFDSRAEARQRLAWIISKGHEVIAQEYVAGPPTNHYFIDGFIDRTGAVRSIFARQRLRMYPPLFGNSTYMKSVPAGNVQPAVESVTKLLAALGYRGMFSAEFKLDAHDGAFKLLEVNARAWWYVEFAARCGANMCEMAYADALELDVPEAFEYEVGRRLVYPYCDYFACRALRRAGELSLASWAGSWLGAAQPVFQLRDPWPAVAASATILTGKLRKRLRPRPSAADAAPVALPAHPRPRR